MLLIHNIIILLWYIFGIRNTLDFLGFFVYIKFGFLREVSGFLYITSWQHCVLYMKKHTQTYAGHQLYDQGAWCRSRSRGRALYRVASRAGRIRTGPPPSRDGDLELEGGVNTCHVEYVRIRVRVPRLPRARYRVMS